MPDYQYNPDRIPVLEEKYARQAADADGDHMTVEELSELEWQRDMKARVIANAKDREANRHNQTSNANTDDQQRDAKSIDNTAYDLGEKLASLRATRDAQRATLNKQSGSIGDQSPITSLDSRGGLARLKKALGS